MTDIHITKHDKVVGQVILNYSDYIAADSIMLDEFDDVRNLIS